MLVSETYVLNLLRDFTLIHTVYVLGDTLPTTDNINYVLIFIECRSSFIFQKIKLLCLSKTFF